MGVEVLHRSGIGECFTQIPRRESVLALERRYNTFR